MGASCNVDNRFVTLAVILIFGALGIMALSGGRPAESLAAPGLMNDAHGDTTCRDCHQPFRGVAAQSCSASDCHPKQDLQEGDPTLVSIHTSPSGERCLRCHSEHRGIDGPLTVAFHQNAAPKDERECTVCHDAPKGALHRNLQKDCGSCHETRAWSPAKFDHQRLSADARKDCGACHGALGQEAHRGIKSQDCGACHVSTTDWERIEFSHAKVKDQACADCHRAPGGWLHESALGINCKACHGTRAWEPSNFDHDPFFIEGEHGGIRCKECHPKSWKKAYCEDCHRGGVFED